MDFAPLIEKKTTRFRELEIQVASATLYDDPKRAKEILREHMRLKELLANWEKLQKAQHELSQNQALAKGDDPEFVEMAQAEMPALTEHVRELETQVQLSLLPPDPNEDRDAILEIRAGTGGD